MIYKGVSDLGQQNDGELALCMSGCDLGLHTTACGRVHPIRLTRV